MCTQVQGSGGSNALAQPQPQRALQNLPTSRFAARAKGEKATWQSDEGSSNAGGCSGLGAEGGEQQAGQALTSRG